MKACKLLLIGFLAAISFPAFTQEDPHAGHQGMQHKMQPQEKRKPGAQAPGPDIPTPNEEERAAAFPDLEGMDPRHSMDTPVMFYALLDQFEWVDADGGSALRWEALGWWGKDEQRLWWRTEGLRNNDETEDAELQLLYGRPFARWWDWVAGLRHDFKPDPSQTWLAVGVQGLAPYRFETEASFFLGEGGQTSLRLEVEYELLLTNRLILQPLVELNFFGEDDPERGIGSGLAEAEVGLRLRYEIRREIAPYIGVSWERAYGESADFARQAGEPVDDAALVAGIRLWY